MSINFLPTGVVDDIELYVEVSDDDKRRRVRGKHLKQNEKSSKNNCVTVCDPL
jgi:hypothetical protein